MFTKENRERFLKDLRIPTQEESTQFPFANASDAARALIKARNWIGNLVEALMETSDARSILQRKLRRYRESISKVERLILQRLVRDSIRIPTWATKNRDIFKDYLFSQATYEETSILEKYLQDIPDLEEEIDVLSQQENQLTLLLKSLDKASDLVIQYINWLKYEAREN